MVMVPAVPPKVIPEPLGVNAVEESAKTCDPPYFSRHCIEAVAPVKSTGVPPASHVIVLE